MAKAILMPKQGNTVEECILVSWAVNVGDVIEQGQVIGEIETDKATFSLEATAAGEVLALLCQPGDAVPVLENVAIVGKHGEDIGSLSAAAAPARAKTAPPQKTDSTVKSTRVVEAVAAVSSDASRGVSPRARVAAEKKGVDASVLAGTGPGGRVIERDVNAAANARSPLTPMARVVSAAQGLSAPVSGSGIGGRIRARDLVEGMVPGAHAGSLPTAYEEVALTGIRRIISERMYESLQKTAQLTINMTANAAALQAMRKRVKAQAESMNIANITINDMILFTVSRMLLKHPGLNATMADGVYRKYAAVNLAFACTTPRGLMVPVISNADRLSLDAISTLTKDYSTQAREGSINPDLLQGGTITVSNLGMLGVTHFTPVLNYPQVAILGVNAIHVKPVRKGADVVFEDHIGLSLTINHQVIDGWDAGLFLRDVCQSIESFDILLAQG